MCVWRDVNRCSLVRVAAATAVLVRLKVTCKRDDTERRLHSVQCDELDDEIVPHAVVRAAVSFKDRCVCITYIQHV